MEQADFENVLDDVFSRRKFRLLVSMESLEHKIS